MKASFHQARTCQAYTSQSTSLWTHRVLLTWDAKANKYVMSKSWWTWPFKSLRRAIKSTWCQGQVKAQIICRQPRLLGSLMQVALKIHSYTSQQGQIIHTMQAMLHRRLCKQQELLLQSNRSQVMMQYQAYLLMSLSSMLNQATRLSCTVSQYTWQVASIKTHLWWWTLRICQAKKTNCHRVITTIIQTIDEIEALT